MTAVSGGSLLLSNAGRLGILALPVVLGAVLAWRRLVGDVAAAIAALNAYTLYVGFPALIAAGVMRVSGAVASDWGFWAVIPIVDASLIGLSIVAGRLVGRRQAGSMALVCLFGNTAYLGIPFVLSVFGASARGPASLLVAVQVAIAVAVGPVLLVRWSDDPGRTVDWASVLRQPLLWAPVLGAAARLLPASARRPALDAIGPLAASTAPVAMFLLGLYLYAHRDRLRRAEHGVWTHVALRMLAAPALTAAVAVVLAHWGALDRGVVGVVVLLGGMPAAITTFSLARHAGVAADRVASVVVRSSLVSIAALPLLATIAEHAARW